MQSNSKFCSKLQRIIDFHLFLRKLNKDNLRKEDAIKIVQIVSRIIKATIDAGFIKLADENASLKNRRYIPYWA